MSKPGRLAQLKQRASAWWRGAQGRHAGLAHIVRAWGRFTANNGNQYAGAITFFSFLALFPLILLAVSITGFVLHANPELQRELLDKVAENLPGGFGDSVQTAIDSAIANRAAVGVVGLVGVLLAGLGWIANLRMAINSVWGGTRQKRPLLKAKISDLIVLAGLGLGALISLAFTVSATSVTDQLLRWIGLDRLPGAGAVTTILGLAIAVLGDMVIFGWLIIRLPRASVPRGVAFRAALLAALGFEVLKIVGSYTIAATSHSADGGTVRRDRRDLGVDAACRPLVAVLRRVDGDLDHPGRRGRARRHQRAGAAAPPPRIQTVRRGFLRRPWPRPWSVPVPRSAAGRWPGSPPGGPGPAATGSGPGGVTPGGRAGPRLTSWIALVTSMPRGQASVQLKVVRQRQTPSAS